MPTLLVVHHTVSPSTQELLDAALAGAHADGLQDVDVRAVPALVATELDVLTADGFVLGTPANIGYMSGALKHFFDRIYYPCLTARPNAPYGCYVHGTDGVEAAVRAITTIAGALGWTPAQDAVTVSGAPDRGAREAVWELAATVGARLVA